MRSMRVSRRTFLVTGVVGSAALVTAYWLHDRHRAPAAPRPIDASARTILAAVVPAMLGPLLPANDVGRRDAIGSTVEGVAQAIAGLAPAAQRELGELFALLGLAPVRVLVARLHEPWESASTRAVDASLESWRTSRIDLLRTAYDALRQLIYGAWYSEPSHGLAVGYPGPPAIPGTEG